MHLYLTQSGAGVYLDKTIGMEGHKAQNFSYIKNLNEYVADGIHIFELEFEYHNFTKKEVINSTAKTTGNTTTNTTAAPPPAIKHSY